MRLLADENTVHGREALEPRGRVDDVSRHEPLALSRVGVERDDRLAGVHRYANLQLELRVAAVQLADRVADPERRPDSPLRVVAVPDRRAEDRHHRIADELLDRAAAGLDLRTHALEVRRLDRTNVFRIELL